MCGVPNTVRLTLADAWRADEPVQQRVAEQRANKHSDYAVAGRSGGSEPAQHLRGCVMQFTPGCSTHCDCCVDFASAPGLCWPRSHDRTMSAKPLCGVGVGVV